jgi:hypothetical protein
MVGVVVIVVFAAVAAATTTASFIFYINRKVNTFFMVLGLSFQNNWRCILIQMRGILNFNF